MAKKTKSYRKMATEAGLREEYDKAYRRISRLLKNLHNLDLLDEKYSRNPSEQTYMYVKFGNLGYIGKVADESRGLQHSELRQLAIDKRFEGWVKKRPELQETIDKFKEGSISREELNKQLDAYKKSAKIIAQGS